ncbi:MAG: Tetratricopeptide 1 repeat-containing protein [Bryobacterales bacterium]|nr:Tetratricopeptide 1 repeat-containing protein [Bryobacterales bacterium]
MRCGIWGSTFCVCVSMVLAPAAAQRSHVDRQPADPQYWYWLGREQLNQRKFEVARQFAQLAIELDHNYAAAYRLLGEADRELNDYEGAYRAWLGANKLDPLDAQVPYYLGRLFYEADQFSPAAAWFREALRLAPGHFAAMTYLGLSAEGLNINDTAGKLYQAAIEASKSQKKPFSLAFLSLAKLLRQGGDESGALALLEEGERLCPEPQLLAALGGMLASSQQTNRAEAVLRRAIDMDPAMPTSHYRLSLLLRAAGNQEEAKAEMELFHKTKEAEPTNQVLAIQK